MSEENVEPMPDQDQPDLAEPQAGAVEGAGGQPAAEDASGQPPAPRKPLSPRDRGMIFGAAIAVCVIVGIAAPLSTALTDERSIMNPAHGTLVIDADASGSSSSAAASSASGAASAEGVSPSDSSSASSSTAAATVIGDPSADEFFLPDSATKLYTAEELAALSDYDLYLARNEAYAKYGRKFLNDDLIQYFSGKSWYAPTYEPSDFDAMPTPLNDTERANVDLIRQIEEERDSPYAV